MSGSRRSDGSAGDVDYAAIGGGYAKFRQPDRRVMAHIVRALGDAGTVLNVGAGTGSYEPVDRHVTAVEPSATMRAQRPPTLSVANRRRLGFGTFMDSTRLSIYDGLRPAVEMLWPKDFCAIYIDGRLAELSELRTRQPRDIALIEVLLPFEAPARFRGVPAIGPNGSKGGRRGDCSTRILFVWTKNALD